MKSAFVLLSMHQFHHLIIKVKPTYSNTFLLYTYVGVFGYEQNKRNLLAPSVISLVISLSNLNTLIGEYNKEKKHYRKYFEKFTGYNPEDC